MFADSNADDFFSNLNTSKAQPKQIVNPIVQPKTLNLQRKSPQTMFKNERSNILASFEEPKKIPNDSQNFDINPLNTTHHELQRKDSNASLQSSVSTKTEGYNRTAPLRKNLISVPKNLFD